MISIVLVTIVIVISTSRKETHPTDGVNSPPPPPPPPEAYFSIAPILWTEITKTS